MKNATCHRRLAHPSPLRGWFARVPAVGVLILSAGMLAACEESGPSEIGGPLRVDTTTLVGTWQGTINGTGGFSNLTTLLNADSTMSGEGTTAFYCKITGTWTVAGGQYRATGRACDGSIVTSVAPFDKLQLTGTWSNINGTSGNFILIKQP